MSLIAVTTSQGLSVISSSALQASDPNPAPIFTAALTPPSRIPSSCISWSHDGSSIFVASGGSVSAYDPTSGAWLRDVIREGEGGIGGAKLGAMAVIDGPDTPGLMLALARGPRAVIFDTEARRAVLTIEGHKSSIQAMSVACDQSLLATCSGDSTMVTNIPQQSTVVLRGAPAGALAAAFHPSRRTTLLILSPKGLHVFDTTKGGAPIRTIPISKVEGTSASIAFSSSTSSLVAVALPGRDSRVVLLDIDKDSSLLKKFNVEENVTAMSFSHDGATIIVTSETGRVMQLNLRSTDAHSQAVAVDPAGGRIGGMALVAESPTSSNTLPRARPARTDSLPSLPTADSLRIKASVSDLRGGTLRKRPSTLDVGPKSPESPHISSPETLRNRSPQLARTKSSVADLHKRSPSGDLKTKVSPGALRIKAGVENKLRPTSMISAGSGKERVRVRPMSLVDHQSEGEGLSKATRDTISRASRPSLADLKTAAGTPSPGSKVSSANGSPLTKNDRESTISPTSRRQTQTMPRRLTSDGSRPPTIAQIFAQDDAVSAMRTRSPSQSTVPLSAVSSQSSLSNGRSTPLSTRPSLRSTTPNYTPGVPAGSATSDEPEEQILVPRPGERERPWSRLGEDRARSRLGNETPKLPTLPAIEDRPRSRIGTEDRPRSRAFEDRLVSESERERPSSRLFRDGADRPASRAGTLGASGSATLGLGRPTGLARRFSTDLKPAPEAMRVVSESGITRERAETFGSLRDRPEPVLKKRASAIFREQSDALFRERERERSSTPLSGSSTRNSGKRVGWVDTESSYVSAPLDTIYTPARPRSGLANNSVSGSNSSDEDESDCAHRGSNALLVTPRRGLAAALGAEVYAGETPTNKGNSTSMTKTQAQDLLRNIVSDVMFEFRQETKEDVRGLHLDLLRASRGWKSDLKEYLGDTLEELRLVKEENARLRAEITRLRRGY